MARDIAGEKPLYYTNNKDGFFFSSEAKSLKFAQKPLIENNKFYNHFQYCFEKTLWKGVKQLKPAHYLKINLKNRKIQLVEHWKFRRRKIYLKDAQEELDFLIRDSVRLRNRSDVNIGLYYSRGVDSTLLRIYHNYKKLIYFDDKKNYLNDFNKNIEKIAYHLDFPVGSLSSYPLLKLAQKARKNKIKVVISGEGADEIFGGYVRYMPIAKQYYNNKIFPSYEPLFNKINNSYLDNYSKLISKGEDFSYVKYNINKYFTLFDDPINAMGFVDFKLIMPGLLQMGDRMSSALGIENRCPFLDKRIIEFGFSLPPELKINNFTQKKLLLELFYKKNKKNYSIVKEKKGLSFNIKSWYTSSDQNRNKYSTSLYKAWKKAYNI